jgi:hypothetical protein
MSNFIVAYTLDEALADGVLHRQGWLGRKPLVATAGTVADLPFTERKALFDHFLKWREEVEPTLPEEERLFSHEASNGQTIWIIDDGAAITLLYPHEY